MRKPTRDTVAGRHLGAWYGLVEASRRHTEMAGNGWLPGSDQHTRAVTRLHEAALRYARSVRP